MTDYTNLVNALRGRAQRENEWYEHGGDIIEAAADAIEALKAEVKDAINEGYNAGYTAGIGYCSFKRAKQPHWVSMEEEVCGGCVHGEHKYANCIDCALANAPTIVPAERSEK